MINNKINSQLQMFFIYFFLITCILIVYGQVINQNFINIDDGLYVTGNLHVQNGFTLNNVFWAFTTTTVANWHPLTWLSFMIDHEIYGLRAAGYHFTNLLFHLVNTCLLFLILNRMTGSVKKSGFVAALFALHPLHVESVAWVSARKDVLSAFFWLLTIWAYNLYVTRPNIKRYFFVLAFFALGLMAKPMVVTLPFILILLDYWPINRFARNQTTNETFLIMEKIPLLILTIFSCVVTYIAQKHAGAVASADAFPLDGRIANAIVSYAGYIGKTLWPNDLSAFYPHPGIWLFGKVFLSGFFLLISSLLVLFSSRRYPYLAVGWLWFLGTLVPVIGLVQVGDQAMADRYTYIPLIGLFIMIVWGVPDIVKQLPYRKIILSCGSILIIITLSILSWQRCQLWGDKVALWDDVLKNNKVAFAYNIRGLGYADQGQYQRAIQDYNDALIIKSDFAEAYSNRANAFGAIGQRERAFHDFDRAIRLRPNYADAYYNRGILYKEIGHYEQAITDFTMAINIQSDMADAFNNRGITFGLKKQFGKALADFNQALSINRNFFHAYYNRGIVYKIYKKYDLAIADFTEALRIKPDYADAARNLRAVLKIKNRLK